VPAVFKVGLATAQNKVDFYEGFLIWGKMDERQKKCVEIALRQHRDEVRTYQELLERALKKTKQRN
jgi:hypothetical protein